MTKLRIQNKAPGQRGVYVLGELEFIDGGKTRTFPDATAEEVAIAAGNKDFRVQSSDDGAEWEELSQVELPKQRPWLAIATDSHGGNMVKIPLGDAWYIGTAIASDEPENPEGYEWVKVGGADIAPLTESAAIATGQFDPVAWLNQPAAQLDFTDKPLELLLETERANKNRKGVVSELEELLTKPKE